MKRRTFLQLISLGSAAITIPEVTIAAPKEIKPITDGVTNFGALSKEQKEMWSRSLWNEAREKSAFQLFIN